MYVRKTANTWGRLVRTSPKEARAQLAALLKKHEGNVRAVASSMRVGRVTLYRWLSLLGMAEAPNMARRGEALPWENLPVPSPKA